MKGMTHTQKFSLLSYKNTGLTSIEAQNKIKTLGKNKVEGKKPPTDFYFFIKQFQNPLVLVLIIAIIITMIIGDFTDSAVIGLAVLINTALGFIQERKAFKSLESLKQVVTHETYVIRNGHKKLIDVALLVPGDIVVVYEGDKVPADGLVIESTDLFIEEALLTGESIPVEKQTTDLPKGINSIDEMLSKKELFLSKTSKDTQVFMGTIVTSGIAKILVTQTGMDTQLGSIATHIDENRENKTPLEKKLDVLARYITIGVIILSVGIFFIGIATQRDPIEMFTTAVAIAVAAIPEGLVIGLTAILAVGMNKILKRKGLVRTLLAAETLGSVTTVCVDKTGTLTEGKMKVSQTKTDHEKLLYKASTLANDRKDPIEIARWEWARKLSTENKSFLNPEELQLKHQRNGMIPFSGERRFLAVQVKDEIFLSGAPEELMAKAQLTKKDQEIYTKLINDWASNGQRLIGYGYIKEENTTKATQTLKSLKNLSNKKEIIWLGLMSFDDPVRTSAKSAIQQTKAAGIDVKVITGDYSSTAISVMKQLGINVTAAEVMMGEEVERITVQQLQQKLKTIVLFARTKPAQKLKIVKALKENGEIVGMMGDGINDAPALATADIGIVVENASEVAKEASALILLDSNMKTIVAAIEEGRAMFSNLRKVILYLLSDSFAELFLVLISILTGAPLAITAAQILWINLIDDGLPNLALTIDPKEKDLLKKKPLPTDAKLINSEMLGLILIVSITAALSSLVVFNLYLQNYGITLARTMVFAILSVDSLLYVYSCRSLEKNIWEDSLFDNKPLILATILGLALTLLSIHLPILQTLLGTVSLSLNQWGVVFLVSFVVIICIEGFKWIWNVLKKESI